ncbi:MAG: V-type ATP synthase subunit F [Halodesulfurarchaeum sp.]|nr:V-type ATP synthase subunit F [Halodesulfurarchaeum sp.]
MSQEIAVIGAPEFTTGFRLAGVHVFENVREGEKAERLDEAVETVLDRDDVGIVIMHADDLEYLSRRTERAVSKSIEPTVLTLGGGQAGGTGLRDQIKRAIGIDLMDEEES